MFVVLHGVNLEIFIELQLWALLVVLIIGDVDLGEYGLHEGFESFFAVIYVFLVLEEGLEVVFAI